MMDTVFNYFKTPLKITAPLMVRLLLILCFIAFIAISGYHAFQYGFTSDEVAHLSAAYSYRDGLGLNTEHPPLQKTINAVFLEFAHAEAGCPEPNQWECSRRIFIDDPDSISIALIGSRFTYILFNTLPFLIIAWLMKRKYISSSFGLIFLALYTFSPSFISQTPFITFDVSGSWLMAMSVLLWYLAFMHRDSTQQSVYKLTGLEMLSVVTIVMAFMTKFSSVILLPIFAVSLLVIAGRYAYQKNLKGILHYLWVSLVTAFSGLLSIVVLYAYSFRSLPLEPIFTDFRLTRPLEPFVTAEPMRSIFLYGVGVWQSLRRSQDWIPVFVDDGFTYLDYQELIGRVFWFKETPIFLMLLFLAVCFVVMRVYKRVIDRKKVISLNEFYGISFLSAFPVLYWVISRSSHLTIGYRHFYPVLIFIYGLLAFILSRIYQNGTQKIKNLVGVLIACVVVSGIVAIPAGLSYVNFFWKKPVYSLASDSTISWGQFEYTAMQYFDDEGLIEGNNEGVIGFATWNQSVFPSDHILRLYPDRDTAEVLSYDTKIILDEVDIEEAGYQYIALDTWVLQEALDIRDENELVQKNLELLEDSELLKVYSDVYWIYKIDV